MELEAVGLKLNASKTKILHSDFPESQELDYMEVGGRLIEILHSGS